MKAQTRVRVNIVKEALLTGAPVHEIIEVLSKEFGVAPSSIRLFITKAYREMEGDMLEERLMMQQVRKARIEKSATDLIATRRELDSYLTQIVRGERPDERVICTPDGAQVVKVAVGASDLLKVADKIYGRLEYIDRIGHLDPEKKESARDIINLLKAMNWEERRGG